MRLSTLGSILTLALGFVLAPLAANAPQPGKVYRIGVLATTYWPPFDAFREGLRELGYVEGQNITLEYRWAEQRAKLFPDLAAYLVRLKVDVIVTWGTPAAQAAKQATSTIPIVMASSGDAMRTGLVTSLARPHGNLTGADSPVEPESVSDLVDNLPVPHGCVFSRLLTNWPLKQRRGIPSDFLSIGYPWNQ
jgi:putative ABC transport system substrate-binding protein